MTRFATAAAALLAALIVGAAPAAAAKRSVPQGFYGMNWDHDVASPATPDAVVTGQFDAMASAGVESLRTNFYWALAQRQPGAPFDFAYSDRIVREATSHGISVLPVLIVAPAWARDGNEPFAPPRDPNQYAAYLTALIQRYGPSGSFWPEHPELPVRPLRHWQIWNEPHLGYQWAIPNDADYAPGYGKLLRVSYAAAKTADPGSRIVLAGLANQSWKYLSRLYRKGRIKGYYDIAALHPYTAYSRGITTLTRRFRDVMRQRGESRKQVWITEFGLPASKGRIESDNFLQTTDRGMARFLSAGYSRAAATRRSRRVAVTRVYWYTWATPYCCELFRFAGLFDYDPSNGEFKAMPAFRAYARSARDHQG